MDFKIPSKFRLGGREWIVERVGKKKWFGRCNNATCVIELSARCKNEEEYRHTFLHELTHALLYVMGQNTLFEDERFVDGLSSLLLQVIDSGE